MDNPIKSEYVEAGILGTVFIQLTLWVRNWGKDKAQTGKINADVGHIMTDTAVELISQLRLEIGRRDEDCKREIAQLKESVRMLTAQVVAREAVISLLLTKVELDDDVRTRLLAMWVEAGLHSLRVPQPASRKLT